MNKNINNLLNNLNACQEAKDWAKNKTWEEIFNTCHRGDWLLWLFEKTNPLDIRQLTLAKAYCAKTVEHLMKDERSKKAIEVAIKFGNNQATDQQLKDAAAYAADAAANAADAAANAADADAYANAAYAAANAADADAYANAAYAAANANAAYAAANAADADAYANAAYAAYAAAAAYAAYANAAAAYAAAYADAKKQNQLETANLCRRFLSIKTWNITFD